MSSPLEDDRDWLSLLTLMPTGPTRAAEDQALVNHAMARFRSGETDLAFALSVALSRSPRPDDLELLEELVRGSPSRVARLVAYSRDSVRAALGLHPSEEPSPPNEAVAQRVEPAKEWMDEDD